MKTTILSTLLILALAFISYSKPIIDIYSMEDQTFTEEAYVDDIPFDTYEIAVAAVIGGDEAMLSEEPYADDIPFDTRTVVMQYMLKKMTVRPDESNVNDIPFDTEKVMYEQLAARMTSEYRDEQNTSDLPVNNFGICDKDHGPVIYTSIKTDAQRKPEIRYKKYHRFDYPVITPVRLEIPRIEMKNNNLQHDIIALPSLSL